MTVLHGLLISVLYGLIGNVVVAAWCSAERPRRLKVQPRLVVALGFASLDSFARKQIAKTRAARPAALIVPILHILVRDACSHVSMTPGVACSEI